MGEVIKITRTPSLVNDEPILAEGAGVRVVDIVDRLRAGDSVAEVAKDFGVHTDGVQLLWEVAKACAPPAEEAKTNAARKLWEAATTSWHETDEETGDPVPLGRLLHRDDSFAYPGAYVRGSELYEIGVALGFIEEAEPE